VTQFLLSMEFETVMVATSAREALFMIRANEHFDFVLIDASLSLMHDPNAGAYNPYANLVCTATPLMCICLFFV
jgi:CheY-like chemotaxis protein